MLPSLCGSLIFPADRKKAYKKKAKSIKSPFAKGGFRGICPHLNP